MIYAVTQNPSTEFSLMFVLHSSTRKSNRLSNVIVINEQTNKILLKAIIKYQSLKFFYKTLQEVQSLKNYYFLRAAIVVFLSVFMLNSGEYVCGRIAFSTLFSFGRSKFCNPEQQHGWLCLTEVGWQFCAAPSVIFFVFWMKTLFVWED